MNRPHIRLLLLLASCCMCCMLCGCVGNQQLKDMILIHVYVIKDNPPWYYGEDYTPMKGQPKSAGVYKFYYKNPNQPWTGTFKKIGSIPLKKINETTFYGKKYIKKINGDLCIGYPSSNFIDGITVVKINQSKNVVYVTIHYWQCNVAVLGG